MKLELFSGDYLFTGSHADKVRKLTAEIDSKSGASLFNSGVELFIIAALVGCINNRTAQKEKSDNTFRIMTSQFNTHRYSLMQTYKMVLLCADSGNVEPVDRIKRAFREYSEDYNFDLFLSYVLGGVDELYSVFFENSPVRYDDYLNSLKAFLKENSTDSDSSELSDEDIFGSDVF